MLIDDRWRKRATYVKARDPLATVMGKRLVGSVFFVTMHLYA
jgi:hypothetical protein